jgi:hypothetical protein
LVPDRVGILLLYNYYRFTEQYMPALKSIIVNDGQATPAAHTFGVVSQQGSRTDWVERSAGTPAGFYTLNHEVRKPSSPSGAHQVRIGIGIPVTATVDGALKVVRTSSAQVVFNLSNESTLQERKDLLAYITNLLSDADVKTTVQNVEPFY